MISVTNTQNRLAQDRFDSRNGPDGKIMRPAHPLAYLRLFFSKHLSKVFLLESLIRKNDVNPVNYTERQINPFPDSIRDMRPTPVYHTTPFHHEQIVNHLLFPCQQVITYHLSLWKR